MKSFSIFKGARGAIGTMNVTAEPRYNFVIQTTNRIRERLLKEKLLRQPFLDLLTMVHKDDFKFRSSLSTDADVINFITDAFPDIYLLHGWLASDGADWDYTLTGQGEANKEYISIGWFIITLWEQSQSSLDLAFLSRMIFMFIIVLLRETAHSALWWYVRGACDSLHLGEIRREASNFMERQLWDGILEAEFEDNTIDLVDIGIMKNGLFFPIDAKVAQSLIMLNLSNGLPLLDTSALSPAPPIIVDHTCSKLSPAIGTATSQHPVPTP
ncbi:hypothetical protein EW146_g6526 [Bondarzewia mesenterica]|uniref:Uncharacterized protein n=1 Tax=Bondarzewia mesenterica TaxID=1095465 RepID=A0A4S4LN95_9AGAM|nr:hypothetical protein EW146_g6526 [Bondarzewia mesenterica]